MFSTNKDWFVYEPLVDKWSRVLIRGGGDFSHQVTVPITGNWEEVSNIVIKRVHITPDSFTYTHNLPDDVYKTIYGHLGQVKADVLINTDLLPLIDWSKFSKNNSETCPLASCIVSKTWFFEISSIGTGISQSFPTETQYLLKTKTIVPQSHISIGGITHIHNGSTFSLNGSYDVASEYVTIELKFSDGDPEVGTLFNGRVSTSFFNRINSCVKEIYTEKGFPQSVYDSTDSFISTALANLAIFNNK